MATSGSTSWTLNRDAVIKGALRKLAVLPAGSSPTATQINDLLDSLNALVKALAAEGMPVWKIMSKSFTTLSGAATYTIGPTVTPSTTAFIAPAPLKVLEAFYTPLNGNNTPLNIYTRYDYYQLPNNATGTPVNIYCQPLGYANTSTVSLWPIPDNSTTTITVHYQALFEDMLLSGDNFDFPAHWMQALIYNLAWVLAPEYGVPPADRNLLAAEAKYWKDLALSFGSEEGSLYLQPRSI